MAGTLNSRMTNGIFNTAMFEPELPKTSFGALIQRLMPNGTAPLFTISERFEAETAVQWKHGFWTKTMVFPSLELVASITAGTTVFNTSSTENTIENQLYRFEATGEVYMIERVLSDTQVVVRRGIGGGATAIDITSDNPRSYNVGNAFEESSLRPNPLAISPVYVDNVTQIFRNTWAVSGSAEQVQVLAGSKVDAENKADCAKIHVTDLETGLIFGRKSMGFRNGQPFRTMDGLLSVIGNLEYYPSSYTNPNVYTAATSGTDSRMLEDMLDPSFNQTTDLAMGNSRIIFAGGHAMRVFNDIARLNGQYQLIDGQTNWGLRFKTLTFARGSFDLIEHQLFNTNQDWRKMALSLDIATFRKAYLGNRKTIDKPFTGTNPNGTAVDHGIDAIGGSLLTEMTMLCRNPPANAVITNLTRGLRDPV